MGPIFDDDTIWLFGEITHKLREAWERVHRECPDVAEDLKLYFKDNKLRLTFEGVDEAVPIHSGCKFYREFDRSVRYKRHYSSLEHMVMIILTTGQKLSVLLLRKLRCWGSEQREKRRL